ncbi:imidazole glycerol phosphate synthase subunit HisH [Chitinophagaceae bacterium IBVUCB2]|nr:imidazole glycerol phosphate synthase subunit HisH [Chitinophagaceae bacterium IBVUCB2]
MKTRVCIPDFGMGNLHSVERSLCRMNVNPVVSADPREIEKADKIILPGVGHFKKAMENLVTLQMIDVLNEFVLVNKKPILGICLGMQLMADRSDEGDVAGFGWMDGSVKKIKVNDGLKYKIPHTGWNQAMICKDSPLLKNIPDRSEFYFLHAYHFIANDRADVLTETIYETRFPSAVARENIFGVQFHPEKSHATGAALLQNFISY